MYTKVKAISTEYASTYVMNNGSLGQHIDLLKIEWC